MKAIFVNGFEIWISLLAYIVSYLFEIPLLFTIAFGVAIASVIIRFIIGCYYLLNK